MPRTKSVRAVEQTPTSEPQENQASAVEAFPPLVPLPQSSVKVTRRNLVKIQEQKYMENIDQMLDEFYNALRVQLRKGNSKAIDIAAQIVGLAKSGGVSIVNNIVQQNSNRIQAAGEGESRASFASIVRRLDARDKEAASPVIDVKAS